ncbi:MAG: hypothetical protein ACQXXJ_08565, partial [Candidatus Bathyarchaeia archaeon]
NKVAVTAMLIMVIEENNKGNKDTKTPANIQYNRKVLLLREAIFAPITAENAIPAMLTPIIASKSSGKEALTIDTKVEYARKYHAKAPATRRAFAKLHLKLSVRLANTLLSIQRIHNQVYS